MSSYKYQKLKVWYIHYPKRCGGGCFYCFAKDELYTEKGGFPVERFLNKYINHNHLIYLFCNTDINFIDTYDIKKFFKMIEDLMVKIHNINKKNKIVISVLTKYYLDKEKKKVLQDFAYKMKELNYIFKIGTSFSTYKYAQIYEPNTHTPDIRIEFLQDLAHEDIETFAMIKPVLPFINIEDYFFTIDLLNKVKVNYIVIGGLYKLYKVKKYRSNYILRKTVWFNRLPTFLPYIEDSRKINHLMKFSYQKGIPAYSSDIEASLKHYIVGG